MSLLLYTQATITYEDFKEFHHYYANQIPKKVQVKGFLSAFRYQNIQNPLDYVTLYLIEDKKFLTSLLSSDLEKRDPVLQLLAQENQPFIIEKTSIGVYELQSKNPSSVEILKDNSHITIENWDWKEPEKKDQLNQSFDEHYVNEILNYPDHTAAFRYELSKVPAIQYTNTASKNLLIVEYDPIVPSIELEQYEWTQSKKEKSVNQSIFSYCPIAKHWKIH